MDTFCDVRKARKKLVMFPIELEEIPFPFSSDRSKSVVDLQDKKAEVVIKTLILLLYILLYRMPEEPEELFCPGLTKAVLNQIKKPNEIIMEHDDRFKVH